MYIRGVSNGPFFFLLDNRKGQNVSPQQRETLVYRIISGYIRIGRYKLYSPTNSIQYEAGLVYQSTLSKCTNLLSIEDIPKILVRYGIWSYKEESRYKKIAKDIEDKKEELYLSRTNSMRVKIARNELETLKLEYSKLFDDVYTHYAFTKEGVSTSAQTAYIISKCLYYNGKLKRVVGRELDQIILKSNKSRLSEIEYRELARNDPWTGFWVSIKNNAFKGRFTEELVHLVRLSHFFDNIAQSPDCPSDEVLDDSDMLDGYLVYRRKKDKKEETQDDLQRVLGSNATASEVFIVCNDEDENAPFRESDVERIQDMNDNVAKNVINKREKKIEKDGRVCEVDLPDVNQRLLMEINNASKR